MTKDEITNQILDEVAKSDYTIEQILDPSIPLPMSYRDPATERTWTGKGRLPNWLNKYMSSGQPKEKYQVIRE